MSINKFGGDYDYMGDQKGTIEDVPEAIYDVIAIFDDLYEGVVAKIYKHDRSRHFVVSFYKGKFEDESFVGSVDFDFDLLKYGG